jgi:hypothetical protein
MWTLPQDGGNDHATSSFDHPGRRDGGDRLGGAQAVPRPTSCPRAGNSSAPFYGVTASHAGEGTQLHVGGNYRLKQRNRALTLSEAGASPTVLRLKLSSSRASGHAAGCPHFGGSFNASTSVERVQITDWNKKRITVSVGRPRHHA